MSTGRCWCRSSRFGDGLAADQVPQPPPWVAPTTMHSASSSLGELGQRVRGVVALLVIGPLDAGIAQVGLERVVLGLPAALVLGLEAFAVGIDPVVVEGDAVHDVQMCAEPAGEVDSDAAAPRSRRDGGRGRRPGRCSSDTLVAHGRSAHATTASPTAAAAVVSTVVASMFEIAARHAFRWISRTVSNIAVLKVV